MEYNFITNIESCYQEIPRLLYYSHIPTTIIVLFFGVFLLFKSKGNRLLSLILFSISFLFSIWTTLDLVLWRTYSSITMMSLWSFFGLLYVLIYALSLYFVHAFVDQKDISRGKKFFLLCLVLPILIATPTTYNLSAFDIENCQPIESAYFNFYQYSLGVFLIIWILHLVYSRYTEARKEHKKSILSVGSGILLFLLTFSWSEIVGSFSENFEVTQYGLFGAPIFIGFLVYSIVKFKTFNIKILATEALVWALWLMIGAILFVAQTNATRVVTSITEVIAVVFGIMLIKSVRREVEQKEKLAALNLELEDKNQKLAESDRQKSELVSFANHDLQSPINKIKGFADLIIGSVGEYTQPAKIRETVQKIKFQGEEATKLVTMFLDLRKIEEGQMPYNPEKTNFVAFVRGIVDEEQTVATAKKVSLSFTSNNANLPVLIDTTQVRQVIEQLISNSLKYTEPAHADGKGQVTVSVIEEQASVVMKISDNGLGMDQELLPVLFGQFRRAPGVTKKIQGTGLGLYVSKMLIEMNHGQISAESAGLGKGSSFSVRLPKAA